VEKSDDELEAVEGGGRRELGLVPQAPGRARDGNLGRVGPPDDTGGARSSHRAGKGMDGAPLADRRRGQRLGQAPECLGSRGRAAGEVRTSGRLNELVVAYIRFFQTKRASIPKWLGRRAYIPMKREGDREESGFRTRHSNMAMIEERRFSAVEVIVREGRGTLAVRARHFQASTACSRILGG